MNGIDHPFPSLSFESEATISKSKRIQIIFLFYVLQKKNKKQQLLSHTTYLFSLSIFKLLQLLLETQIRVGAGPDHSHRIEHVLPAQACHCHDVGYDQGDTARHSCQTEGKPNYMTFTFHKYSIYLHFGKKTTKKQHFVNYFLKLVLQKISFLNYTH